jgi:hypothetical protein
VRAPSIPFIVFVEFFDGTGFAKLKASPGAMARPARTRAFVAGQCMAAQRAPFFFGERDE